MGCFRATSRMECPLCKAPTWRRQVTYGSLQAPLLERHSTPLPRPGASTVGSGWVALRTAGEPPCRSHQSLMRGCGTAASLGHSCGFQRQVTTNHTLAGIVQAFEALQEQAADSPSRGGEHASADSPTSPASAASPVSAASPTF